MMKETKTDEYQHKVEVIIEDIEQYSINQLEQNKC